MTEQKQNLEDSRYTQVYGLMNSMYYLEDNKPLNQRFIRLQGQYRTQSQKQLDQELERTLQTQIQINSFWAWTLLFLAITLAAVIPCWIMSGKMQFFTKNGWRFLVVTFCLIPFLMYEQRIAKNQTQKLGHFLNRQKLKPIFISTINFSIWFGFLIYACKYTSMNHALCFSGLRFFLISLLKMKNKQKFHEFEVAGSFLCIIGIILVCTDSITLPMIFDNQTRKYLKTQPWKRLVIGDVLAFIASICSVYLDQNMKVPGMPRFTYMFFYHLFNAINLITFGYFFGGTQFSFHPRYGIFGIFTYENFVQVFYVGLILGFLMIMVQIIAAQIFNQLAINIATSMKTIICSMFMHALHLELIMSGLTCLGYCFIAPGMIFIIGGQGALHNKQNKLSFDLYKPPDLFAPKLIGQVNNDDLVSLQKSNQNILESSNLKNQPLVNILKPVQKNNHQKKQ